MSNDHEWRWSQLSDHAEVRARIGWKNLTADEYVEDGYIFLSTPNIKDHDIDFERVNYISKHRYDESPELMLEIGDVLLTKDGSTLGTSNIVRHLPSPATVNGSIARIRCSASLDPHFLHQVTKAEPFQRLVREKKSGLGVPHLFQVDLREFLILLPPLPEQKKIAAILSSVDEAIQATRAVIEQTRRVKEGLLQDLLARGIGHTRFQQTEIGEIPDGWSLTFLAELLVDGPTNGVYKSADEIGRGSIIVGQTAFTAERTVDFDATRRAIATPDDLSRYGLEDGDILVTRVYATPEGCGQPVFVENVPEPCIYESNMMRLRTNRARVRSAFLFNWLRNPLVRRYLMARASSSNQTSINQTTLARLPCAVPPLQEQDDIVQVIDGMSAAVRDAGAELSGLREVKAGLLQDLLTGKVRVSA